MKARRPSGLNFPHKVGRRLIRLVVTCGECVYALQVREVYTQTAVYLSLPSHMRLGSTVLNDLSVTTFHFFFSFLPQTHSADGGTSELSCQQPYPRDASVRELILEEGESIVRVNVWQGRPGDDHVIGSLTARAAALAFPAAS